MTEEIEVLDSQFPPISDAELDAIVKNIPEPTEESKAHYQRLWNFMLDINREVGVFQDVVVESAPEEMAVANNGKYMDVNYGFGNIGHRSESANH